MRKSLVIIAVLILLCGCTNEYSLVISNDSFKENIDVIIDNNFSVDVEDDELTPFLQDKVAAVTTEDSYYKKKVKENDTYKEVNLKYNYNAKEFLKASSINLCFEYPELNFEKSYYINLQGYFYCLYGDSIDIKIKTNNKVNYHNADQVIDNVYIWHIDESNQSYVDVEIDVSKGFNYRIIWLIIGILIIIGICGLIGLYAYGKYQKKDQV